jgi:NADH dehydrogenase [ubiquinone] 1 alpha subcomplex assembly factor 7
MEAEARLESLLQKCPEDQKEILKSGLDMLVNPEKMGQRFKFLSVFPGVLKKHLQKFPVSGF